MKRVKPLRGCCRNRPIPGNPGTGPYRRFARMKSSISAGVRLIRIFPYSYRSSALQRLGRGRARPLPGAAIPLNACAIGERRCQFRHRLGFGPHCRLHQVGDGNAAKKPVAFLRRLADIFSGSNILSRIGIGGRNMLHSTQTMVAVILLSPNYVTTFEFT